MKVDSADARFRRVVFARNQDVVRDFFLKASFSVVVTLELETCLGNGNEGEDPKEKSDTRHAPTTQRKVTPLNLTPSHLCKILLLFVTPVDKILSLRR